MNIFFELEKITDKNFNQFKELVNKDSLKLFEEGYGYQHLPDQKIKKVLFKKVQGYFFNNKLEGEFNYLMGKDFKLTIKTEINILKKKFNFIMVCRNQDINF